MANCEKKTEALRKNRDELQMQSTEMTKLKLCMNEMRLEALMTKQCLTVKWKSLKAKKCELDQVQLVGERKSGFRFKLTTAVDEATEAKKQCIEEPNSLKLQLMVKNTLELEVSLE